MTGLSEKYKGSQDASDCVTRPVVVEFEMEGGEDEDQNSFV